MTKARTRHDSRAGDERVLRQQRPTVHARSRQPVVMKQGSMFLLCTNEGDIERDTEQGLYFHDMRYLSEERLSLDEDVPLISLLTDAGEGNSGLFELTNSDLHNREGGVRIAKQTIGIRREKRLGDDFVEVFDLTNFGAKSAAIGFHLYYDTDFADMFVVRGMHPGRRGTHHPPRWDGDDTLIFRYDGADGHSRVASLRFSTPPEEHDGTQLRFRVRLEARATWRLQVTCDVRDEHHATLETHPGASGGGRSEDRERAHAGALGPGVQVVTSSALLNRILTRSFLDLHMLSMRQRKQAFFAAGVPWYVALFGRDSLISAIEMLAFEPDIAANTLRVLATHQGREVNDFRDEQPGKIPHELRDDEMANLGEVPQAAYYGSVDSTPLFLDLIGRHAAWAGSLDLFHELRDPVRAALRWIDDYGDSDGDGFVDYQTRSSRGGRNQGWKDSGNGIVMEDGALAEPPIALPEVQGDVFEAWSLLADLFERDGDAATAGSLRKRAQQLYHSFNESFWLPAEQYVAFCRQRDGRFSKSIASNGAHSLWTGIVDPVHAGPIVRRVLERDMFSGWGIRTLSSSDRSFNPFDYQVGSIWPHDNALIAAGMHRYGYAEEACRLFSTIVEAATQFDEFRLPELFAGHDRSFASKPVQYPVACSPQAWAAASVPFMLYAVLGLRADGFEHRLVLHQPSLPDWLDWVELRGVRVADASVDLRFRRSGRAASVEGLRQEGDLQIVVEKGA